MSEQDASASAAAMQHEMHLNVLEKVRILVPQRVRSGTQCGPSLFDHPSPAAPFFAVPVQAHPFSPPLPLPSALHGTEIQDVLAESLLGCRKGRQEQAGTGPEGAGCSVSESPARCIPGKSLLATPNDILTSRIPPRIRSLSSSDANVSALNRNLAALQNKFADLSSQAKDDKERTDRHVLEKDSLKSEVARITASYNTAIEGLAKVRSDLATAEADAMQPGIELEKVKKERDVYKNQASSLQKSLEEEVRACRS